MPGVPNDKTVFPVILPPYLRSFRPYVTNIRVKNQYISINIDLY